MATFGWDLDSDGAVDGTGATSPTVVPSGPRTATLVVTDGEGCTATATQAIAPRALPVAAIDFTVGDAAACAGDLAELDGSPSRDADGNAVTAWAWELDGDGVTDVFGPRTGPIVPADGDAPQLTVTDALGCTAVASQPLSVRGLPQVSVSVAQRTRLLCLGDAVTLDASASRDADGAAVSSYAWDLDGDGATESTEAQSGSFLATAGAASVTVGDASGCTAAEALELMTLAFPRGIVPFPGGAGEAVADPVDIIMVVDNSRSMTDEIASVERNINTNFAQILAESGLDYRIIMIAKHGSSSGSQSICVRAPLSGTSCSPIPARPVNGPRFFHYDVEVGSHDSLQVLLDTYGRADVHGFAPDGWSGWLRPGAVRAFVEITDDESTLAADAFETALYALQPPSFGTAAEPGFVFYSIVGLARNAPATAPWEPADPLQYGRCSRSEAEAPGLVYQRLSVRTGGLRFPLCEYESFDAVFQRLAAGVIETAQVACTVELPPASTIDPGSVLVEYEPGDGGATVTLSPVASEADCGPDGFYVSGSQLLLCPDACAAVQADSGASLRLTGCPGS